MENFTAYNPTKLHFGKNIIENLGETTLEFGKRVLLIYGKGSIQKNGIYDKVIQVTYEDAVETSRNLAKLEGLFVGISAGAAAWAALNVASKDFKKGQNVVAILPDTGERYLTTELFQA